MNKIYFYLILCLSTTTISCGSKSTSTSAKGNSKEKYSLSNETKSSIDSSIKSILRANMYRAQSQGKMRNIAKAMLSMSASRRGFLPQCSRSKNWKPLLSWRVHLLPALGHKDLYKQFKLDEPWDSQHNTKLISKMPEIYSIPNYKNDGTTVFQIPMGRGTPFFIEKTSYKRKRLRARDIKNPDRLAMIVQVGIDKAVPWTKPEDMAYDPVNPKAGLGDLFQNSFNVVNFNFTMKTIPIKISNKAMRSLCELNFNEPLADSDLDLLD